MQRTIPPWSEPSKEPQFLGRYRLLAPLGQGGMGAIHLAVMSGTGEFRKLVVVKELRRDLASNRDFVNLFLLEAKLAGRLTHPHIVQTLEAGQDGERYFLAMEFLDGQPFNKILQASVVEPFVPLRLRLQVICDVLAGLHYAHELCDYDGRPLNIVHCDVSPPNVFVTYGGHVKVVDFGIAKASGLSVTADPGVFKGKLRYAAPEQLLGENVDRRADLFSAGVMLWEAISLQRFTTGPGQDQAVIERRLSGTEPRISEVSPQVSRQLAGICDKALSVHPKDRFKTADEFRDALVKYMTTFGSGFASSSIGELMARKFANERAQQHQLIHERTAAGHSLTPVHTTTDVGSSGGEVPTAVADLSELVESIRSEGVAARAARKSRAPKIWIASTAALGVAVGGLIASRGFVAETGPVTALTTSATAPARALAPVDSNAQRVMRLPVVVPESEASTAKAVAPEEATEASAQTQEPTRKRKKRDEDSLNERSRGSGKTAAWPKGAEAETTAQPGKTGHSAVIDSDNVGKDLRAIQKQERRGLDADNPFR